ncbi:CHAT domain-containing protein [Phenylobacterium sp. LjRoot219]|uniref:CHAT domain-containing protein n=1 Tax=Phenylobacterium sp. LjRoot219 TaxID=3342283 RepID=UPI003ECD7C6C
MNLRSHIRGALVALALLTGAKPAVAAADPAPQIAAALQLQAEGRGETARRQLEALLQETVAPSPRLEVSRALLDVCLGNGHDACVVRYAPTFAETARATPPVNDVQRQRLALQVAYYFDQMRLRAGVAPAAILAGESWRREIAYDGDLYLRRQVFASNLWLETGNRPELDRSLAKILSLVGSLKNPQAARTTVAASLADVIATLLDVGETERAWGLYRASGADIGKALPPVSLDAAAYRLTAGKLHQQVGDAAGARTALDAAVQILRRIELEPAVRERLLAEVLTLRAALDASAGDAASAQAALVEHPFAALYATSGRAPQSLEEISYLAARSLVANAAGGADPIAAAALQKPLPFKADAETAELEAVYRTAGAALALPPGPERGRRLMDLAARLQAAAWREDAVGALGRLGAVDQILVGLALSQAQAVRTPAETDAVFTLFQLANRAGPTFDADALATLAQAEDELQRRTLHQALRLRARRDRLERQQIQKVTAAMLAGPATSGLLQHDVEPRRQLRDYAVRLAEAEATLGRDRISLRGARLVGLRQLQGALAPDEAALAIAPTVGGMAYMCVRRESATALVAAGDLRQTALDTRLVQAALTAGHAPSEALDAQFPAAAAVRLYDRLIRPFEACLKPNDKIVWMGGVATVGLPLAALLRDAPPKLAQGYDLAAADWLVRRHAVSYAGSAGVIVARRSAVRTAPEFDFLGVGDPVLDAPGKLTRGVRGGARFAGLAPLPETRRELEASARGFGSATVLVQNAATERGLRSQMLGAYRYLSFATHGLLRDDLQGLSEPALVLTPVSGDAADDGLLTASEIADMNLRASFVALSACNTANFDLDAMAQDLPALASAFAVSGVPATLGTLWPVDSATGEAVVSGLFARLRADVAPAQALAEAQRAFLAAPPGRAFLHPRFWAPFLVLGDGTAAALVTPSDGPALKGVEMVAPGEVLALAATPDGVAARFIATDAGGKGGAGVRTATQDGEAWRQVEPAVQASRALAQLGSVLVTGGYERGAEGRLTPRLDAYDRTGRRTATWRGTDLAKVDAGVLAAAVRGPETLLIAVAERSRVAGDPGGGRLQVLEVGPDLKPRLLFTAVAPIGAQLSAATLAVAGDRVLVTYTADNAAAAAPPGGLEDYDAQACLPRRITWAEVRDLRTGEVLRSEAWLDLALVAAASGPQGAVLLAGSRRAGCEGERQAVVVAVDAELNARTLHADESLGASEVRALQALPDGRLFVAAYKQNLMDYAPPGAAPGAGRSYSTLVFTLDRHGRASPATLLDAGADVLPNATLADDRGGVLLGGSLGGQGAVFRLAP